MTSQRVRSRQFMQGWSTARLRPYTCRRAGRAGGLSLSWIPAARRRDGDAWGAGECRSARRRSATRVEIRDHENALLWEAEST